MLNNFQKKANILSVWWFLALAIIGIGIVLGVILFFSASINVKPIETKILMNKVSLCVQNYDFKSIEEVKTFDFIANCGLNTASFSENSNLFILINVSDSTGTLVERRFGANSLEQDCRITAISNTQYFPACQDLNNDVIIDGKDFNFEILVASNNDGGPVNGH